MSTPWSRQRLAIFEKWKGGTAVLEQLLLRLPAPAPTPFRDNDAEQAVAHAEVSVELLHHAAEMLEQLAKDLAPHLDACIGYDITDAMVIDLDLPTVEEARVRAENKHEYTKEDAEEEAAEHRGDMERDEK